MKILLTGHKGFIGSHLLTALDNAGHSVDTFEWNDGNMPSVMEQDWVIHLGAISSTTEHDIEKIMRQNVNFTVQLYNACKKYSVGFQYASSASVYGLVSSFKEDSALDPRTPYASSKYVTEKYILENPMRSPTQIFRYFNVYGPEGEEHKGDQASPYMKFTKQAKETGVIKIFENSDKYLRDFIHVSEVVKYHLMFLEKNASGIFNIGTGNTKSFQEVAEEICEKHNAKIEYVPMPEILKSNYQAYTCADMTNTKRALSL